MKAIRRVFAVAEAMTISGAAFAESLEHGAATTPEDGKYLAPCKRRTTA